MVEKTSGSGPVSEVVAVPRHVQAADAPRLPNPPVIASVATPAPATRQSPHHWSDPPPRLEPLAQPERTDPTAPTPYFTVPASAAVPPATVAATPVAPAASAVVARTSEPAKAHPKTPPRGSDAGRDSGDFSDHDNFFSTTPQRHTPSEAPWDEHDDFPRAMAHGSKRAMVTTFWILGVSVALIGAFVIYNQVVMPAPAPLTGVTALDLPTPSAVPTEPTRPAPAAPVATPPASTPTPVAAAPSPSVAAPTTPTAAITPDENELPENEPDPETYELPENEPEPETAAATPSAAVSESYQELLEQASIFYRQGKRQRALEAYELAIAVNPNGDEALSKLAYHYLNTGKNEEARQFAQRAVAANPKSSEGWIVLGAAREALRDREGANEAYRQCATIAEGSFVNECKRLAR